MKKFLDNDFVLQTKTAKNLFHNHAKNQPIIDYHCHLIPEEVATDKKYENITQVWLYGDHYKWRAMRTNGVDERFCTGDASDSEKFEKWAETVPHTLRNPLYHWTHLELKRYFGVEDLLSPKTSKKIWDLTAEKLASDKFSSRNLMRMMKVEVVCTTDDPIDSLEHHIKIKNDGFEIKVLPTWRPDKAMAVDNAVKYNEYIDKLSEVSGVTINSYDNLLEALQKRHDFFAELGCKLSDHGIETFYGAKFTKKQTDEIFAKIRKGSELNADEIDVFKSAMMYEFGVMDHAKGWAQQFHYGAMRNNNTRLFNKLGPDTGFDSIGDYDAGTAMSRFFDGLDEKDKLAKTIIYNLNPRDNDLVATMIGNFQDGSVAGKMQFGSGWWFLDQKDGMEKQINSLSNLGLLSRFVGMLTDSRSFLSYPRHEYFRRILCNIIGNDVEDGLLPNDMELLGKMVEDICYYNAKRFFDF
ncbi:glucuronate isomerase [Bacteroidota bacterium]